MAGGAQAQFDALRQRMAGEVLAPGDPGYDDARQVHNGMVDKRPAVIARCQGTADVVDAVTFAREQGLEISVRGGGHNVAGRAVTEGGLMVDLAPMRGIFVDPGRGTARAEGGVTWGDYNRATHLHGLATTGGVVSTTGIAGLTLGGGLGWMMGSRPIPSPRPSRSSPRSGRSRNYLDHDDVDRTRAAYGPNWERLMQLKRRYDPDNVFHLDQNIDPAAV